MKTLLKSLVTKVLMLSPGYRKLYSIEKLLNSMNHTELQSFNEINKLNSQLDSLKNEITQLKQNTSTLDNSISKSLIYELDNNLGNSHNARLSKESPKDRPLFLIGSGPSLKDCDLTKLKGCYTMSFNRSYIAFEDWGFEPTYFAGLDHVVNKDNKEEFKKLIKSSKIKRFFFPKDDTADKNFVSDKTSIIINTPDFPLDTTIDFNHILKTSNSGLFGLQIAIGLLGFKEVYLLGCDANYTEEVKGVEIVDSKYVSTEDSDNNHFRKDYYGKGTTYNKPWSAVHHLPAWKAFYENNIKDNNLGFKVYNCSKTGKLTFFPFADFSEVVKRKNISI